MVPIGSAVTELNEILKNLEISVSELKSAKLQRLELQIRQKKAIEADG